jgi:hypothetical protein
MGVRRMAEKLVCRAPLLGSYGIISVLHGPYDVGKGD